MEKPQLGIWELAWPGPGVQRTILKLPRPDWSASRILCTDSDQVSGNRFSKKQSVGSRFYREVNTMGLFLVMIMVCSYCAEKFPGPVVNVQPSSSVVVCSLPVDRKGSIVMT